MLYHTMSGHATLPLIIWSLLVGDLPSPVAARPTKRVSTTTSCSNDFTISTIGDVTNCTCPGLDQSSDHLTFNGDDSQIVSLSTPKFFGNFTNATCEGLCGYTWGGGSLASDVSFLYQTDACNGPDPTDPGNKFRVDSYKPTKCPSGFVRIEYLRELGEEYCPGPIQFSKEECQGWLIAAKRDWLVTRVLR